MEQEAGPRTDQLGFFQQEGGTDYRFPLQDLSFIDEMSSCDGVNIDQFRISCTEAYRTLHSNDPSLSLSVYYEYSRVNVILKDTDYDFTGFLLEDSLKSIMNEVGDIRIFITENTGKLVVAVDKANMNDLKGKTLSKSLFPDDKGHQSLIDEDLIPFIKKVANGETPDNVVSLKGSNVEFIVAIFPVSIPITSVLEGGYSVGVLIKQTSTLKNASSLIEEVVMILVGQVVIFLFFILLSLLSAWALSKTVTNLIVIPLREVELYLLGEISVKELKSDHNKESKKIVFYLRLLDTVEKFVNPNFLLNPKYNTQIKNLVKAEKVFEGIKNKRGQAGTLNLIGNSFYEEAKYQEAVAHYQKAYDLVVELYDETEGIIPKEDLGETEIESLKSWESEQICIIVSLYKRSQQLWIAKRAHLEEEI